MENWKVMRHDGERRSRPSSRAAWLTALAASVLLIGSPVSAIPVTNGLVGYWSGDGHAQDSSGFNNHGTLIGDATFAPGRVGQAFAFDGSGDAMQASAIALPTGHADRTLAFWVYRDRYDVIDTFLAGWGNTSDDQMSSVILGWYARGDRKPTFWGFNEDLQATEALTDGRWHHVAFTLESAVGTMYVDGTARGSGAVALNTPTSTAFRLAADSQSFMYQFSGLLDEVAVYSRALSPNEVQMLVPEPTTLGLLALGGLAIIRRRRRLEHP